MNQLETLLKAKAHAIQQEDYVEAKRVSALVEQLALKQLMDLKQQAIIDENYIRAKHCKEMLLAMEMHMQRRQYSSVIINTEVQLSNECVLLSAEKDEAVELEDFDRAAQLKASIDDIQCDGWRKAMMDAVNNDCFDDAIECQARIAQVEQRLTKRRRLNDNRVDVSSFQSIMGGIINISCSGGDDDGNEEEEGDVEMKNDGIVDDHNKTSHMVVLHEDATTAPPTTAAAAASNGGMGDHVEETDVVHDECAVTPTPQPAAASNGGMGDHVEETEVVHDECAVTPTPQPAPPTPPPAAPSNAGIGDHVEETEIDDDKPQPPPPLPPVQETSTTTTTKANTGKDSNSGMKNEVEVEAMNSMEWLLGELAAFGHSQRWKTRQCKELLLRAGVSQQRIDGLGRWDCVHMLQELAATVRQQQQQQQKEEKSPPLSSMFSHPCMECGAMGVAVTGNATEASCDECGALQTFALVKPLAAISTTELPHCLLALDDGARILDWGEFDDKITTPTPIYPVGYKMQRWFLSTVTPNHMTVYTATICRSVLSDKELEFVITCDEVPNVRFSGSTSTEAWQKVVTGVSTLYNERLMRGNVACDGDYLFSLKHPEVVAWNQKRLRL